jgi:hypothetical protein
MRECVEDEGKVAGESFNLQYRDRMRGSLSSPVTSQTGARIKPDALFLFSPLGLGEWMLDEEGMCSSSPLRSLTVASEPLKLREKRLSFRLWTAF